MSLTVRRLVAILGAVAVAVLPTTESPTRGAAAGKGPAALGAAEFERLCKELHVKNQPWASVPWHISVTEARAAAARARKPIFLVVNTGNCLGFV
jgi:hypothetical protein